MKTVVKQANHCEVRILAIDETSRARNDNSITLGVDAERRAVIFLDEGCAISTVETSTEGWALRRRPRC